MYHRHRLSSKPFEVIDEYDPYRPMKRHVNRQSERPRVSFDGKLSLQPITIPALCMLLCWVWQGCTDENTRMDDEADAFAGGKMLAVIQDEDLREASGMAVSSKNRGKFWVHNDSGNGAELFLLDRDGDILEVFRLGNGAQNRDWEDMAIGTSSTDSTEVLYIADIGDNAGIRETIRVYVIPEPIYRHDDRRITDFHVLRFRYRDRPRDAEALMIDPFSNQLVIVSKRDERSIVYTAPIDAGLEEAILLDSMMSLPFNFVTGGEITRDGREILIKTYDNIYYWRREPHTTLDETLRTTPITLRYKPEPQGEAIAWDPNASGYYTISEKKGSASQRILYYPRR